MVMDETRRGWRGTCYETSCDLVGAELFRLFGASKTKQTYMAFLYDSTWTGTQQM